MCTAHISVRRPAITSLGVDMFFFLQPRKMMDKGGNLGRPADNISVPCPFYYHVEEPFIIYDISISLAPQERSKTGIG